MRINLLTTLCLLALAHPALHAGEERASESQIVRDALESIEACHHWAGEVGGGGGEERARQIDEGAKRDCPDAKRKGAEAYRLFPRNPELAIGILMLKDIAYIRLSRQQEEDLCRRYADVARQKFRKSGRPDYDFRAFCPAEAAGVYR